MKIKFKFLICLFILFVFAGNAYPVEEKKLFSIGIFKEKEFPYLGTPEKLTADWIAGVLNNNYKVTYLNIKDIKDQGIFNIANFDLLILPYGDAFPESIFFDVAKFIRQGGGIFTVAGIPFGKILRREESGWKEFNSMVITEEVERLGINTYPIYKDLADKIIFRSDILDVYIDADSFNITEDGVFVKTSERFNNIQPTKGNIFPFRIPSRENISAAMVMDENGYFIGSPFVLVKSWANPYVPGGDIPKRWCLMTFRGEDNILNPRIESAEANLREIVGFLSESITVENIGTKYYSYRPGEVVEIEAVIFNNGDVGREIEAVVFITDEENDILFESRENFFISPNEKIKVRKTWDPDKLEKDFYTAGLMVKDENSVLDTGSNSFTVWHEDELKKFPWLRIKENSFYQGDESLYLFGMNYYESKTGELLWVRPNVMDLRNDLSLMADFGINFLRIHYHHPKWFRDFYDAAELELPDYFSEIGDYLLPDERSLRIMDAIIILCNKYGIYFQPDIFTLVPSEMGSPIGWIGDHERCTDKEKIDIQKKFIKILADRYKDIPNITWDLWNEPFLEGKYADNLKKWTQEIIDTFRTNGSRHLITIGSDESIAMSEDLDYVCGHGHEINVSDTNKPFLLQEIWNESGLTAKGEKAQERKLEKDLKEAIKQKSAGFAPWQWTRQSRLWGDISEPENWDNELGVCTREDGSLKPAGIKYKELIKKQR